MASSPSTIDSGDTAFVLMSAAFIFLMTPAFAFFYGGMVDKKNILNTLTLSFICIGVISIQFFLVGYSFAFATGSRVFGDFSSAALYNWSNEASPYSPTIPSFAFFALQCAFAVVTPAIMSGSIVGRMKFKAYVIFIVLWSTLVYDPIAHCIWSSNGWLKALGVIDFSGGVVVHLSSGFSALVASVFVGKRENQVRTQDKHVAFTVLGAGLLWVGWFGFGSGSALQAGARASLAMLNINLAAAGGMLMWLFLDAMQRSAETPLVSSAAYGFTVGMVGITPGSGLVHPGWALVIGIVTCACSWAATELSRNWAWLDDTLDVFACHGIGGAIGSILVSLFAQVCSCSYVHFMSSFHLFPE